MGFIHTLEIITSNNDSFYDFDILPLTLRTLIIHIPRPTMAIYVSHH